MRRLQAKDIIIDMSTRTLSRQDVVSARPSVPEHVVSRDFVNETVVLNLRTGVYHGLNPSGARMLQELGSAETVHAAAESLAAHFGQPLPAIEEDLTVFCLSLHERGLLELTPATEEQRKTT